MKALQLIVSLILIYYHTLLSQGQSPESFEAGESTISVFDKPVEFTGWKGEVSSLRMLSEIHIGLFIPYDPADPVAEPILQAAELAISEFNSNNGYHGLPFRLKTRWSYNPWGAGSKEMIKLVYEDSVWAVIGSLDGTATHIAQQIVTKARVPLLSPVSADPTLTYIRIPWIFRLPPDFKIQTRVIAQQGIETASLKKVGLITSTNHDGRTFAKDMITQLGNIQVNPIFHFEISAANLDINELIQRLGSYEIEAMVWYLPPPIIKELIGKLPNHAGKSAIILPWIPGVTAEELSKLYDGKIYFLQSFSTVSNPAYTIFADKYFQRFGMYPPADAAYTYDAVGLLVHSLFKSGLSRSRLREEIASIGTFEGVTGKICWDNGGGNQTEPVLKILQVKKSK